MSVLNKENPGSPISDGKENSNSPNQRPVNPSEMSDECTAPARAPVVPGSDKEDVAQNLSSSDLSGSSVSAKVKDNAKMDSPAGSPSVDSTKTGGGDVPRSTGLLAGDPSDIDSGGDPMVAHTSAETDNGRALMSAHTRTETDSNGALAAPKSASQSDSVSSEVAKSPSLCPPPGTLSSDDVATSVVLSVRQGEVTPSSQSQNPDTEISKGCPVDNKTRAVTDEESDKLIQELSKYIDKNEEQDKTINADKKFERDRSALFDEDRDSEDGSKSNKSEQLAEKPESSQHMDVIAATEEQFGCSKDSEEKNQVDYKDDSGKAAVLSEKSSEKGCLSAELGNKSDSAEKLNTDVLTRVAASDRPKAALGDPGGQTVDAELGSVETLALRTLRTVGGDDEKFTSTGIPESAVDQFRSSAEQCVSRDVVNHDGEDQESVPGGGSENAIIGTSGSMGDKPPSAITDASSYFAKETSEQKRTASLPSDTVESALVIDTGESQSLQESQCNQEEHNGVEWIETSKHDGEDSLTGQGACLEGAVVDNAVDIASKLTSSTTGVPSNLEHEPSVFEGSANLPSNPHESLDVPLISDTGESQSQEPLDQDVKSQNELESSVTKEELKPQSTVICSSGDYSSPKPTDINPSELQNESKGCFDTPSAKKICGKELANDNVLLSTQEPRDVASSLSFTRKGLIWHCSCGFNQSSQSQVADDSLFANHILQHDIKRIGLCTDCPSMFCGVRTFQRHFAKLHPEQPESIILQNCMDKTTVLSLMERSNLSNMQIPSSSSVLGTNTGATTQSGIQTKGNDVLQSGLGKECKDIDLKSSLPSSAEQSVSEKKANVNLDLGPISSLPSTSREDGGKNQSKSNLNLHPMTALPSISGEHAEEKPVKVSSFVDEAEDEIVKNDPVIHSSQRLTDRFSENIKRHSLLIASSRNPTPNLDCGFIRGQFWCISCNWGSKEVTEFHIHILVHVHRKTKQGTRICNKCIVPGVHQILAMKCPTILDLMRMLISQRDDYLCDASTSSSSKTDSVLTHPSHKSLVYWVDAVSKHFIKSAESTNTAAASTKSATNRNSKNPPQKTSHSTSKDSEPGKPIDVKGTAPLSLPSQNIILKLPNKPEKATQSVVILPTVPSVLPATGSPTSSGRTPRLPQESSPLPSSTRVVASTGHQSNYSLTLMNVSTGEPITLQSPVIIPPPSVPTMTNVKPSVVMGSQAVGMSSITAPVVTNTGLLLLKPPRNIYSAPAPPLLVNNIMPQPLVNQAVPATMPVILGSGGSSLAGSSTSLLQQPMNVVPLGQASGAVIPNTGTQAIMPNMGTNTVTPGYVQGSYPAVSTAGNGQNMIYIPLSPPSTMSKVGTAITALGGQYMSTPTSVTSFLQPKMVSSFSSPSTTGREISPVHKLVSIQPKPTTPKSSSPKIISDWLYNKNELESCETPPAGSEIGNSKQSYPDMQLHASEGESSAKPVQTMHDPGTLSDSASDVVLLEGDAMSPRDTGIVNVGPVVSDWSSAQQGLIPMVVADRPCSYNITPVEKSQEVYTNAPRTPSLLSRVASQYGSDIPGGLRLVSTQSTQAEGSDTITVPSTNSDGPTENQALETISDAGETKKIKAKKQFVAGFPHSLPASMLAKHAVKRLFVPVVKVCYERGLYQCKNCKFSSAKDGPFRRHIWRDLHRGYFKQKSPSEGCIHCPPDITYNKSRHCPYLNNLMAVLEQVRKHSFSQLYKKFKGTMVRTKAKKASKACSGDESSTLSSSEAASGNSSGDDREVLDKKISDKGETSCESNFPVKKRGKKRRFRIASSDDGSDTVPAKSDQMLNEPSTNLPLNPGQDSTKGNSGVMPSGNSSGDDTDSLDEKISAKGETSCDSNFPVKKGGKKRKFRIASSDDGSDTDQAKSDQMLNEPNKNLPLNPSQDSTKKGKISYEDSEDKDVPVAKTGKPSKDGRGLKTPREGSGSHEKPGVDEENHDGTSSEARVDPKKKLRLKSRKGKVKTTTKKQKSFSNSSDDSEYEPDTEDNPDDSGNSTFVSESDCVSSSEDDTESDPDWQDTAGKKKKRETRNTARLNVNNSGRKRKRLARLESTEKSDESEAEEAEKKEVHKKPQKKKPGTSKESEEKPVEACKLIVALPDESDSDLESMTCQRIVPYSGERNGPSKQCPMGPEKPPCDILLKCAQSRCRRDFSTEDLSSFLIHYHTSHYLDSTFICFACNSVHGSIEELMRHITNTHPAQWDPMFHCFVERCHYGTQKMSEYKSHLLNQHMNEAEFRCYNCQSRHDRIDQLMDHVKGSILTFTRCSECGIMAELQSTVRNHYYSEHTKCALKATVDVFTSCHRLGPNRDRTLCDKRYMCACQFVTTDLQEHADHLQACGMYQAIANINNIKSSLHISKKQPIIPGPASKAPAKSESPKPVAIRKGVTARKSTSKPAAALSCPKAVPKKPLRATRPVAKRKTALERLGKGEGRLCSKCDYRTECELLYSVHMALHSNPPARTDATPFQCKYCPYVTSHKASIVYHMGSHPSCPRVRLICCIHCDFASTCVEITEAHLDSQHPSLECRFDGQSLKLEFACPSCQGTPFTTELLLLEHMSQEHGEDVVNTYVQTVHGIDLPAASKAQDVVELETPSDITVPEEDPGAREASEESQEEPQEEPTESEHPVMETTKQDSGFGFGLTCPDCGFRCNRVDKWVEHVQSHGQAGDIDVFYCKICEWPSNDKRAVCFHASTAHGLTRTQAANNGFEIQIVNVDNISKIAKARKSQGGKFPPHVGGAVPQGPSLLMCDECDYCTNNEEEFLWHMRATHAKRKIGVAKKHTSKHPVAKAPSSGRYNPDEKSNQYRWHCELCPFGTNSDSARLNHIAQHEKQMQIMNGFKCPYCAYRAINRSLIKKHQNIYHVDEPRAVVPIVNSLFGEQMNMDIDSVTPPDPLKLVSKDSPAQERTTKASSPSPRPPALPITSSDECPVAPYKTVKKKSGVPPLPESLKRILAEQGISLPDVIEFPQLQKCPRCDHATRLRQVLVRHWNKHEENDAKKSDLGSSSTKDAEMELEEESEPEPQNKSLLTAVYRRRMKKIPDKMLYQCKRCVFMDGNPERVNAHYREKHVETGFRCGHCAYHADSREFISTHSLLKHRQSPLSVIDLSELSDEELDEDEEQTILTLKQLYRVLDVYVFTLSSLEQSCQMCGTARNSKPEVLTHILRDHLQFMPYKCKYCPFLGVAQYEMKDHLKCVHPYLGRKVITRKYVGVPPEVIALDLQNSSRMAESSMSLSPAEDSPLGIRIENVASISPGMGRGNVSALNWGLPAAKHNENSDNSAQPPDTDPLLDEDEEKPSRDDSRSPISSISSSGTQGKGRKKNFYCMHCSYRSLWCVQDVERHIASLHMKIRGFGCRHCHFRSPNKQDIYSHGKKKHPGKKITVGFGLPQKLIIKQDGRKVHVGMAGLDVLTDLPKQGPPSKKEGTPSKDETSSQPPSAQQTKRKKKSEKRQRTDEPAEGGFGCKECDYSTSNLNHMFVHILGVHHLMKAFSCSFCGYEEGRVYKVQEHVAKAHPGEKVCVRKIINEKRKRLMKGVIMPEQEATSPISKNRKLEPASPTLPSFPLKHIRYGCSRCSYASNLKASILKHSKKIHRGLSIKWRRFGEEEGKVVIVKEGVAGLTSPETLSDPPTSPLKIKISHSSQVRHCEQCELECESSEALEQHILHKHSSSNQGSYHCMYCSSRNKNKYKMKEHCRHKHPGKSVKFIFKLHAEAKSSLSPPCKRGIKCQMCFQVFLSMKTLEMHMYTHAEYTPYHCKDCPYKASSLIDIRKHYIKRHPNEEVQYNYVSDAEKIDIHKALMQDYDQPSTSAASLQGSSEGLQVDEVYQCVLCSTRIASLTKMEQHLYKELKHVPYKCSACVHSTYSRKAMKKHIAEEHGKGMAFMLNNRNPEVEQRILTLIQQSYMPVEEAASLASTSQSPAPSDVSVTSKNSSPQVTSAGRKTHRTEQSKVKRAIEDGIELHEDEYLLGTKPDFICKHCDYRNGQRVYQEFNRHLISHIPYYRFKCIFCDKKRVFSGNMRKHIATCHKGAETAMEKTLHLRPGCNPNSGPLWREAGDPDTSLWYGGGKLKCPSCGFRCDSSKLMRSHEMSRHGVTRQRMPHSRLLGPKCRWPTKVVMKDFMKMSISKQNNILERHDIRQVYSNR